MSFFFFQQSDAKYWFLKLSLNMCFCFLRDSGFNHLGKTTISFIASIVKLPTDVQDFPVWLPCGCVVEAQKGEVMLGAELMPDLLSNHGDSMVSRVSGPCRAMEADDPLMGF